MPVPDLVCTWCVASLFSVPNWCRCVHGVEVRSYLRSPVSYLVYQEPCLLINVPGALSEKEKNEHVCEGFNYATIVPATCIHLASRRQNKNSFAER